MSFNFGSLPQGESTFTIDPKTMIVTIKAADKTVYGQVFGPGNQSVPNPDSQGYSGSLTIPTGCIAIAFQLKGYDGTDHPYEDKFKGRDLDRIVYHPYYYAMIFEKQ